MPPATSLTTAASRGPDIQPVLIPRTFDQLVTFSEMAAASELVPKDYRNKPANVMIAVQMGSELGLSPMQAIQSIAVINGRPGVWGDGLIGLCRQSPLCQDIIEKTEGTGDARTAICTALRRGAAPVTASFSVADAKKAGLWGKAGPWQQYPDRMLRNRARGFALRDAFPDVLRGLKTAEELRDTPPDTYQGTTLEGVAEPQAEAPKAPPPKAEPEQPRRRTTREWMDELRARLDAAPAEDLVHEIARASDVQWALDNLRNPARQELTDLLAKAIERVATAEHPQGGHTPAEDAAETGDGAEDTQPADEEVFPGDR